MEKESRNKTRKEEREREGKGVGHGRLIGCFEQRGSKPRIGGEGTMPASKKRKEKKGKGEGCYKRCRNDRLIAKKDGRWGGKTGGDGHGCASRKKKTVGGDLEKGTLKRRIFLKDRIERVRSRKQKKGREGTQERKAGSQYFADVFRTGSTFPFTGRRWRSHKSNTFRHGRWGRNLKACQFGGGSLEVAEEEPKFWEGGDKQ